MDELEFVEVDLNVRRDPDMVKLVHENLRVEVIEDKEAYRLVEEEGFLMIIKEGVVRQEDLKNGPKRTEDKTEAN